MAGKGSKRTCGHCGSEIKVERWSRCPNCGAENHFKINKQGRIKKVISHPPKN